MNVKDIYTENRKKPIVIALGFFDCVHIGHRKLISTAKSLADSLGAECNVFTFSEREGIFKKPNEIYSFRERQSLFKSIGIDNIIVAALDNKFADLRGVDFLDLLFNNFDVKGVVCGSDYRFGRRASCGIDELKKYTDSKKVKLVVEDFVLFNGEKVSTSMISDMLVNGDLETANKLLYEPYFISDVIVSDCKRGRTFGCPTANVRGRVGRIKLKSGVYATKCHVDGVEYPAVTNVGDKPTFDDYSYTVESFLIDFHGTIYGETVKVSFYKYLRPIRKFSDSAELKQQIMSDAESAKRLFYGEDKIEGDAND